MTPKETNDSRNRKASLHGASAVHGTAGRVVAAVAGRRRECTRGFRWLWRLSMILLLPVSGFVPAADLQIRAAEVSGFGIFKSATTTSRRGFTARRIAADEVRGVRFIEYTTDIPARPGLNFGFQYIVNSSPAGKPIRVTSVVKFPEPGIRRPGGSLYTESRDTHEIIIGQKALHGYGFDEDWEMVPGPWVFELWHGNALLIQRTFHVYVPDVASPEGD